MRSLHVWLLGVERRKKNNPGKGCAGVEAEAYASPGQGVELPSPPGALDVRGTSVQRRPERRRGRGGAPKGRGWELYTRYRQTAKILRINQSIFLTLVKSANYLYETRRKSALFRKGGGCMEYRGNQCSGRECALSRG